jgi:hypothetical protein
LIDAQATIAEDTEHYETDHDHHREDRPPDGNAAQATSGKLRRNSFAFGLRTV